MSSQRLWLASSLCFSALILPISLEENAARAAAPAARAQTSSVSASPQAIALEIKELANGKVGDFYKGRGYWPLWASKGSLGPETGALLNFLSTAHLDGLKPTSYKIDALREAIAAARSGEPRAIARAELQLSQAFARYAGDVRRRPMADMTYLEDELEPRKLRTGPALRRAAFSKSLGNYVSQMGWMSPHYLRLRNMLARAEKQRNSEDKLRRLRINLDRARALPGAWTHHVVVDAASGQLWYYQAGKQVGTMRVVVGMPQTQTPMFVGMINFAILNPYWNVPVDLAQKRIAPKVLAGKSLKSMGMEALSDWSDAPRTLKQSEIDWKAVAAGKQEVRLRQLPSPSNSMGKVKFLFPNKEGIYLHDSPERALFKKPGRHFSNGCIRLEDAATLGNWLMGKPLKAATKAPEQAVSLPVPVPIYLTYFTATASKAGSLVFLNDVYGRDR